MESCHHFAYLGSPFDAIFTFLLLTSHVILFEHKYGRGHQFFLNVNFNELIVIRIKIHKNALISHNIYSGVFELARITVVLHMVLNRRNIQSNFFDKKRSKEKNGGDAEALTIYATKGHHKSGRDEFWDWS